MQKLGIKILVTAVLLAVAGAVIAGLFLSGTPGSARMHRYDKLRVRHLQDISSAIDRYWDRQQSMPEELSILYELPDPYLHHRDQDPETGEPYEYRVLGGNKYELCANFQTTSNDEKLPFWYHGPERTCFQLTAGRKY